MYTVLHEDTTGQIVQLDQTYNDNSAQIILTHARFDTSNRHVEGVAILVTRSYMLGESEIFSMNAKELNALCESWQAFKASHSIESLEDQAWIQEARQIAALCPDMRLTETNGARGRWYVGLIKPGFAPLFEGWPNTPAQLLEVTKTAYARWKELQEQTVAVEMHISEEGYRQALTEALKHPPFVQEQSIMEGSKQERG